MAARKRNGSLYRDLNRCAKTWWHYRDLRKRGQIAEARKLERESLRNEVQRLREVKVNKGFMSIGRGGATLHVSRNVEVQGLWPCHQAIYKKAGVPTVDTTRIRDKRIAKVLRCPDARPGAFDARFACAKRLGAKTYNWRLGR